MRFSRQNSVIEIYTFIFVRNLNIRIPFATESLIREKRLKPTNYTIMCISFEIRRIVCVVYVASRDRDFERRKDHLPEATSRAASQNNTRGTPRFVHWTFFISLEDILEQIYIYINRMIYMYMTRD